MRFWIGLAIGLVLGATVGWLATARPWRRAPAPVAEPVDAGAVPGQPRKSKSGKRRHRRAGDGGDDQPAPVVPASGRAMTWRGPSISLPERDLDLGSDDSSRPLDDGEIDAVLQKSSDSMLDCIRESLAGASLEGDVKLQMLVTGDGRVSQVRVGAPRWLVEHGLADCASAAARRLRFPATGAPTIVDAPFHID